jgi:hypothetical protein
MEAAITVLEAIMSYELYHWNGRFVTEPAALSLVRLRASFTGTGTQIANALE